MFSEQKVIYFAIKVKFTKNALVKAFVRSNYILWRNFSKICYYFDIHSQLFDKYNQFDYIFFRVYTVENADLRFWPTRRKCLKFNAKMQQTRHDSDGHPLSHQI